MLKAVFARKKFHAEALAGALHKGVEAGVAQGTKDDAEVAEGRGVERAEKGERFPEGEVGGADDDGARRGGALVQVGVERRREGKHAAQALGRKVGRGKGEQAGLDEAAAGLSGDVVVPVAGAVGEGVVEI